MEGAGLGGRIWARRQAGMSTAGAKRRWKTPDPTEMIFAAAMSGDRIHIGGGEEAAARFGYFSLTDKQWTAVATHPMKYRSLPQIMELAASGPLVAALGPVWDSYLHVYDAERETWSDLWPLLARHLGESGEPWERSAWRAEHVLPRFAERTGDTGSVRRAACSTRTRVRGSSALSQFLARFAQTRSLLRSGWLPSPLRCRAMPRLRCSFSAESRANGLAPSLWSR